jgi:hypothetical protein
MLLKNADFLTELYIKVYKCEGIKAQFSNW